MFGYSTFLALSLPLSGAVDARAICVQSPPPCESLKQSSHVFLAEVDSTNDGVVTFRLVEKFKGLSLYQREFRAPAEPLNDESITFMSQHRYLVYGTLLPDGFHTTCSRTREVLAAGPLKSDWLASE